MGWWTAFSGFGVYLFYVSSGFMGISVKVNARAMVNFCT